MKRFRFTCTGCGRSSDYKHLDHGLATFDRMHSCERTAVLQARQERVAARAALRGGERRDCQHKHASHEHGSRLAYVLDKCRCVPCLDAATAYEAYRKRQIAYGRWDHRVPAGPARDRLLELQREGVSYKQVARLTGISTTTLGTLLYGRHDRRGGEPPRTISREHSDLIVNLIVDPLDMTDGTTIDATGSRRRLQALVAIGWSINRLGQQLGVDRGNMGRLFEEEAISVRYARAISGLYERCWDTEPDCSSAGELGGVTRAKHIAAKRGWLPPMAWPDEQIDNPDFDPNQFDFDADLVADDLVVDAVLQGHRMKLTKIDRLEVVRRTTLRGMSAAQIAEMVQMTARQVQRDRDELGLTHADQQSA